jgi:hypothetical protein
VRERFRRSMDRTQLCGSCDAGSIPAGTTSTCAILMYDQHTPLGYPSGVCFAGRMYSREAEQYIKIAYRKCFGKLFFDLELVHSYVRTHIPQQFFVACDIWLFCVGIEILLKHVSEIFNFLRPYFHIFDGHDA